jgi:hypothetical protein
MTVLAADSNNLAVSHSVMSNCDPVAIHQGRQYGSEGVLIVGSRYKASTGEDIGYFMCSVDRAIFNVSKPVRLLQLL